MTVLEIDRLGFTSPTMSAFDLEISTTIGPEVEVPWGSRVTIWLFLSHRLIGKKTLRKTYIIPDKNNEVKIKIESFKVQNLMTLKAFFQRMMPKGGINREEEVDLRIAAALEDGENSYELFISMDLDCISRLSVGCLELKRGDESVRLSFQMSSSSPVEMDFGHCQFILKKDEETLAFLDGRFTIQPGDQTVAMKGHADHDVDRKLFAGEGTLTGFKTDEHNNSFLAHAIRLFKIQVKLS